MSWFDAKNDVENPMDSHLFRDIKKTETKYDFVFMGKVEGNDDPERLGRCKVRILGIMDDFDVADLPWALPEFQFIGSVTGSFVVPPVGCVVTIYCVDGNFYNMRYGLKVIQPQSLSPHRLKNYPNTMIMYETDSGTRFEIDRTDDSVEFVHKSGTTFKIDSVGNVEVTPVGTYTHNGSTVVPNSHGPLNCIQICPFANIPHVGTVSLP